MDKKEKWHGANNYSNKLHLFLILFLGITAITLYSSYIGINSIAEKRNARHTVTPSASPSPTPIVEEGVACTLDVMQCPDGNYVPRTGPNCEFVCPAN